MRARVLDEGDRPVVQRLLDTDPVGHCFVASRVDAGVLRADGAGELWGYPAHAPRSLLHVGANVFPVNADDEALDAFALDLGRWRSFVALVGPVPAAFGLWNRLVDAWPEVYDRARVVRARQLLMSCDEPSGVEPDPRVRRASASTSNRTCRPRRTCTARNWRRIRSRPILPATAPTCGPWSSEGWPTRSWRTAG